MGENLKELAKALENPACWLAGDSVETSKLLGILRKVAAREGVVLGGEHPPIRGKILVATGGTSGNPRFAIHTWDTLCAAAQCLVEKVGEGIHSHSILPLGHVSGFMPAVRAVVSGGKLVLGRKNELPDSSAGYCISLVPTQLARFLDDSEAVARLKGYRKIFLGGAGADPSILEKARELEIPLSPCYGMTETGAMVTMMGPEDFLNGREGCGEAMAGVEVTISPEGQVLVDTPGLCEGYAGGNGVVGRPFETRDKGEFDAFGSLRILRRMDRVIITGGEKVDPSEVEAALLGIQGIREALVVGLDDREWGQVVTAFVTGDQLDGEVIREALRRQLPGYKIPKAIYVVGELPLDGKGKTDWGKIRGF